MCFFQPYLFMAVPQASLRYAMGIKMKTYLRELTRRDEIFKTAMAIFGTFLYAAGMNLFIIPAGLYSGGIMGLCQIIRTILLDYLNLSFTGFDIAGIIYFILNIPIFFTAYKTMGKLFFVKTLLCISALTLFFTTIPIPAGLLLTDDILTSCIIGGIITGIGTGVTLMMGGSAGGMDIISIYFIKKKGMLSVGKLSLIVNLFVYSICFFLFDFTVVIYSVIFAAASSVSVDKMHSQNINMEIFIITKKSNKEMQLEVMEQLGRGITKWNSMGAYTLEGSEVLYIILSKYEFNQLKRIIHKYDPDAFIVGKEGVFVNGNYMKKL